MFSGKTEELMRRLRRAEYARQNVLTIKHAIDNRRSYTAIVSHDGVEREAHPISGCEDGLMALMTLGQEDFDVVGIDEIQFFPDQVVGVIAHLIQQGKRVVVSGLDLDFRLEPFGVVPRLMAMADEVVKLRAICMVCGDEANFTQRLINGQPARYEDPVILVGAEECYEARCRGCYKMNRPPQELVEAQEALACGTF
jgi:thymidine kinase